MTPLRIYPDIAFLAVDEEWHILPQRLVFELHQIFIYRLFCEELVWVDVQAEVDEPAQRSRLEQIESCLVSQHGEVREDGPKLTRLAELFQTVVWCGHMNERIHENNQFWNLCVMCSQSNEINLWAAAADSDIWHILLSSSISDDIFIDEFLLSFAHKVQDSIRRLQQLDVFSNFLFLLLINLHHGCLEQPLCKPCHIMNRTIHQELFDKVLARECLDQP